MPPQEDEITLLDESVVRTTRTPIPLVEDTEVDHSTTGIQEISMKKAAAMSRRKGAKVSLKPVKVEAIPILHQNREVYCHGNSLYMGGDDYEQLAYAKYEYLGDLKEHVEAPAMMLGTTPVFFASKQGMKEFKSLLEKVNVVVQPGKTLCFFIGTEFWMSADNVVSMVSDGEIIRYGGRNSDERIMRLTNPIDQKPDQIFNAISTFASRSVMGVTKMLKHDQDKLKVVTDRRSEDVYLYLEDITPPEDKKELHTFAMSRVQEAYANDLVLIGQSQALIKQHKDKIEKAKSQIPNGRKGVPLRNGYLKSNLITDLLDFFKVIRNGNHMKVIFGFKKDLTVEGIFYGRPEITINMSCYPNGSRRGGTFITEMYGVQAQSADLGAFMHPHIEGRTRWCLGTYIVPINNAIMGGNIPLAASLVWQYLSAYNPESPLIRIDQCRDQMNSARPRDLIVRRK